jgi:hypothetical protein
MSLCPTYYLQKERETRREQALNITKQQNPSRVSGVGLLCIRHHDAPERWMHVALPALRPDSQTAQRSPQRAGVEPVEVTTKQH